MSEQGGFFAARTAANLHDDVFGILWQQQSFEIIFQLCHILTFFADFLLYHLLEVRLKSPRLLQQGFRLSKMVLCSLPFPVGLHGWLSVVILLHQLSEQRRVGSRFGLVQTDGKFFKPVTDRIHLGKQVHCSCSSPYILKSCVHRQV